MTAYDDLDGFGLEGIREVLLDDVESLNEGRQNEVSQADWTSYTLSGGGREERLTPCSQDRLPFE
jgi:hypothetical protein